MEALALDADLLFGAIRRREGLRSIRQIVAMNPQVLQEKSPEGNSPLHEALLYGASLGVITFLVEQRPQALREQNDDGRFLPAHCAARQENASLSVLRCVVEPYPQALLHQDCHGYTPLHRAASAAISFPKVRYLVDTCPSAVRARNGTGLLPLHLACRLLYRHKVRILKTIILLVEKWPESILEADEGMPAWEDCLRYVTRCTGRRAERKNWTLYRRMVEGIFELCPQAVRARGCIGLSPLQVAVSIDAPSWMVGYLLDQWPESILELSNSGMSILHVAAHHSKLITLERVQFLVERDERIVALRSGGDGSYPLHAVASIRGPPPDVIRFLIERHRQALHEKDEEGRTPLHCAVDSGLNVSASRSLDEIHRCAKETAESLISQRPESLHDKDRRGDLPLHVLVQQPNEYLRHDLVECLVRTGPSAVAVTNREGWTPLHLMLQREDLVLARMLVGYCPEALAVEDTTLRRLPLHLACARNRGAGNDGILDVVREFVALRPDSVRHLDVDGWLPLHCAASTLIYHEPLLELIRILLVEYPESARAVTLQDGCLPLHFVMSALYLNSPIAVPLAQLLIEAYPESLQVKNSKGLVPTLVAASNPAASLDLLWHLLKDYPDSIPVPGQPQRQELSSSVGRSSKRPRLT